MTTKLRKLHEIKVSAEVVATPRHSGRCTKVGSAPTASDSNLSGGGSLLTRIYHPDKQGVLIMSRKKKPPRLPLIGPSRCVMYANPSLVTKPTRTARSASAPTSSASARKTAGSGMVRRRRRAQSPRAQSRTGPAGWRSKNDWVTPMSSRWLGMIWRACTAKAGASATSSTGWRSTAYRLVLAAPNRQVDTSTPMGRIFIQFAAIFDEYYAEDISQRASDSVRYRKCKGVTIGIHPLAPCAMSRAI